MSVFSKIRGTIETLFQLGISGPQLKNNSGAVEVRNSADSGMATLRAADPSGSTDVATKNYADTGALGGVVREIRFVLGTSASQSSTTQIPANAIVTKVQLSITTPYSGGGTISVGQTGSASLLMATGDNNPQSAGIYEVNVDTSWGGSPLAVLATVGGSPAAGAAELIVHYISTPAS